MIPKKTFSSSSYVIGQCIRSANEPELGLGHILQIGEQTLDVRFNKANELRRYSIKTAPLERVTFSEGQEVILKNGQRRKVSGVSEADGLKSYLSSEGNFHETEIVASQQNSNPTDALRDGRLSTNADFLLRKRIKKLIKEYTHSAAPGFAGARVVLTPHQLYAVDKIVSMSHPRALLADEVGLGKTIEAALIFAKLKALGRAKKVLILVPEALKHQWLAELYRKFFELFTLVDKERWDEELKSQEKNSFASNSFVLASLDLLSTEKTSLEAALKEKWDLVIVDEAHQLIHLNTQESDTLKFFWQLSEEVKSILFLTATPFRFGEENFELLTQLLKTSHDYPFEYIHNRRDVIQGFPYRILHTYENTTEEDNLIWLKKFLDTSSKRKILLLCKSENFATEIHKYLSEKTGHSSALFVESMDLLHRDKQAAWFASEEGARILVCSEMGSEGRNFQFCNDMILMDLPGHPDILEQRIGRLDRIGQADDVNIHVPYVKNSESHTLLKLYDEVYGIFTKPCPFAFKVADLLGNDAIPTSEKEWKKYRSNALDIYEKEESSYKKKIVKDLDKRSYNAERAQQILKEIRHFEDSEECDICFEALMEHFGVSHDDFGLDRTIKLGSESLMFVESFPHLGNFEEKALTFSRDIALEREDIEFVSLEHPLYQSTLDFFFGKDSGLAGISFTPSLPAQSLLIEGYYSSGFSLGIDQTGKIEARIPELTISKERKLSPQDAQKFFKSFGTHLTQLIGKLNKSATSKNSGAQLDSLHIYIGSA